MRLKRRRLIKQLIGLAFGVFGLLGCSDGSKSAPSTSRKLRLAPLDTIVPGLNPFTLERIAIVRSGDKLFGVSMVCTHQTCLLTPRESGDGFNCPCHGSSFSLEGHPDTGPATEPLAFYRLALLEDGFIEVDFGSLVEPSWRLDLSLGSV